MVFFEHRWWETAQAPTQSVFVVGGDAPLRDPSDIVKGALDGFFVALEADELDFETACSSIEAAVGGVAVSLGLDGLRS